MDARWFLVVYVVLLGAWLWLWLRRSKDAGNETFTDLTPPPSCRFVGSDTADGSCPAGFSQRMATLGHVGADLRCDAAEGTSRTQGEGAQLVPEIERGVVTRVRILFPGSGYLSPPTLRFHGGVGNGAEAVAVVQDGKIVDVRVTKPGYGYLTVPDIEIEPPAPTFSFCHLCCEPDPMRNELRELRDRYDMLERILLEADVEGIPADVSGTKMFADTAAAAAARRATILKETEKITEPLGGRGIHRGQLPYVEDPIERQELADEFKKRLQLYMEERKDEITKAQEFMGVIEKQEAREEEMRRMSGVYGLDFKPMYTKDYIEKIKWIADTEKRINDFLASAKENELAGCAVRWKSYVTPPDNLRPFELHCGAFPSMRKKLPAFDPEEFYYPPPAAPAAGPTDPFQAPGNAAAGAAGAGAGGAGETDMLNNKKAMSSLKTAIASGG